MYGTVCTCVLFLAAVLGARLLCLVARWGLGDNAGQWAVGLSSIENLERIQRIQNGRATAALPPYRTSNLEHLLARQRGLAGPGRPLSPAGWHLSALGTQDCLGLGG